MSANIPDFRQALLAERLKQGQPIGASDIADEFEISIDTARRDLTVLEDAGLAKRVRGGAVPISNPAKPLTSRLKGQQDHISAKLIRQVYTQIKDANTVLLDGGTHIIALAKTLIAKPDLLIVTPSPWVAIACHENSIDVLVIGGILSSSGGIATGQNSKDAFQALSIDVCVLGTCGIDPEFGLSADDFTEAQTKTEMAAASRRTIALADHQKVGTRARHQVLPSENIDTIVTDASPDQTNQFQATKIEVIHA